MNRYYKLLTWGITLICIAAFTAGIIYRVELGNEIALDITLYGYLGLFIITALLDFLPQYLSPFITLSSALLFGLNPLIACSATILGSLFGSIAGFEIGKKASPRFIAYVLDYKNYRKMKRNLDKWDNWIMLIGALTPLPYIPLLYGAFNFRRDEFYRWGVLPRIMGFIALTLFSVIVF